MIQIIQPHNDLNKFLVNPTKIQKRITKSLFTSNPNSKISTDLKAECYVPILIQGPFKHWAEKLPNAKKKKKKKKINNRADNP